MPHKYLQLQQEQITKTLRRNTLISGLCAVTGFCLLIPAFSIEGTKFDYQEFCFKPPSVPAHVTWCKGKRLHKGIAWRVALEASTNQEFQTVVEVSMPMKQQKRSWLKSSNLMKMDGCIRW
jgi:hypothetical protein